jgi:thiol-disulfide isomerase/thioredoxin
MKKLCTLFFAMVLFATVQAQTPLTVASDFTATDVHGTSHTLFDYLNAGKYVLIDFFYTTCGPCQAAAPEANASYENFGCNTGGVIFLGLDYGDSDAEVIAFDNTYGAHYPCISGDAGGTAVCTTYGITAYPTFILIAPDKNIVVQDMWPFSTTICNDAISGYGVSAGTCPVGITDYAQNLITGVYPNPASEQTQFTFMAEQNILYTVSIVDLSGKPVLVQQMNEINAAGEYSYTVPVNNLAAGSYFLVLSSDKKPCGRVPLMVIR